MPQKLKIDPNEKSLLLEIPKTEPKDWATNMSKFEKDKDNFHVMTHLEPHTIRREKILKAHPEIYKLLDQKDTTSVYFAVALNLAQLGMCYLIKTYVTSWLVTLFLAYMVSAVLNHGLFVLMHDITHFTCFKSVPKNQLAGIMANLSQVIPNAITFGRYHRDHHSFLGDADEDPDIPTLTEVRMFQSFYQKLFFLIFMPAFYGLRPYIKRAKLQNKMELINIAVVLSYDYMIYYFFGVKPLIYLLLGTLWGLSIHPVGSHIIAEHYEFNKGQDTYSYYGWMNYLNFNVGYHIEHHDFPTVSWNKLPLIKKMAPEFYDNLPQIDSYVHVMKSFLFDSEIGPWSRVTRLIKEN